MGRRKTNVELQTLNVFFNCLMYDKYLIIILSIFISIEMALLLCYTLKHAQAIP